MKTLVILTDTDLNVFYYELKGDYSKFNKLVINSAGQANLGQEFLDITGNEEICTALDKPSKDWDYFVEIGWIL